MRVVWRWLLEREFEKAQRKSNRKWITSQSTSESCPGHAAVASQILLFLFYDPPTNCRFAPWPAWFVPSSVSAVLQPEYTIPPRITMEISIPDLFTAFRRWPCLRVSWKWTTATCTSKSTLRVPNKKVVGSFLPNINVLLAIFHKEKNWFLRHLYQCATDSE